MLLLIFFYMLLNTCIVHNCLGMNNLQLILSPRDINEYIASFLLFTDRETDEELKTRLQKKNLPPTLPRKTPLGVLFSRNVTYGFCFHNPGIYVYIKKSLFINETKLLYPIKKYSTLVFSANNKYVLLTQCALTSFYCIDLVSNNFKIWPAQNIAKTLNFHSMFISHSAIANDGEQLAFIYKDNNKNQICYKSSFTSASHRILDTLIGEITALDFNKQGTKIGILLTPTNFLVIPLDVSPEKEVKTLEKYFFLKGICNNLNNPIRKNFDVLPAII